MHNCLLPFGGGLQELDALLRAQAAIQSPEIGDVAPKRHFVGTTINAERRIVQGVQRNLLGDAPAWHTEWVNSLKIDEAPHFAALHVGRQRPGSSLIRQPNRPFHNDAQERGNLQKHLLTRIADIRFADALQNRIDVNMPRTGDRCFVLQRWRCEPRFVVQPKLAAPCQSIVLQGAASVDWLRNG